MLSLKDFNLTSNRDQDEQAMQLVIMIVKRALQARALDVKRTRLAEIDRRAA